MAYPGHSWSWEPWFLQDRSKIAKFDGYTCSIAQRELTHSCSFINKPIDFFFLQLILLHFLTSAILWCDHWRGKESSDCARVSIVPTTSMKDIYFFFPTHCKKSLRFEGYWDVFKRHVHTTSTISWFWNIYIWFWLFNCIYMLGSGLGRGYQLCTSGQLPYAALICWAEWLSTICCLLIDYEMLQRTVLPAI